MFELRTYRVDAVEWDDALHDVAREKFLAAIDEAQMLRGRLDTLLPQHPLGADFMAPEGGCGRLRVGEGDVATRALENAGVRDARVTEVRASWQEPSQNSSPPADPTLDHVLIDARVPVGEGV